MQKGSKKKPVRLPQHQKSQPGLESDMVPLPESKPISRQDLKLKNKTAIITGGDSGIGKAVALAFAEEGAQIVISYLNEEEDAKETQRLIEAAGGRVLLIQGDISDEKHCENIIKFTLTKFESIDILVNNAAVQFPQPSITDITAEQLLKTFKVNIFSMFYLVKAALPYLKQGSSIINTASVVAYRGSAELLDYSATKGAIVSFTRSLSAALVKQGIRVNAVAPGPVWTPLIPATFTRDKVATFGSDVPMERAGEPNEIAPSYVFLASNAASYITGQVLHPNGGEVVNG